MKTTRLFTSELLWIICLLFVILLNSKTVRGQDCVTADRDTTEFTELPWFDNNAYLDNLRNGLGYPLNDPDPCNRCRVEPNSVVRYRIPVKIWVYRDNNGNGGPNELQIQAMLDYVNDQHRQLRTGIRFYLKCGISEVRDDDKLNLSNLESFFVSNWIGGRQDIGAVNIHLVQNISGGPNNFYSPFTHSIFIAWQDLTNPTPVQYSTFSHEIGHFMGLDHTHQFIKYNFVARTCFREPVDHSRSWAFISACYKERSRLKCESTGDGLCDTPADPNAPITGTCAFGTTYPGVDLYGDSFSFPPAGSSQPDVRNIMGYYDRICRTVFTPNQIGVMLHSIEGFVGKNYYHRDAYKNQNVVFDHFEPNQTQQTARDMPVGQTELLTFHWQYDGRNGQVGAENYSSCDVDWVRFSSTSTLPIRISTYIGGSSAQPNTRLTLFDSGGNQIAQNDDANGTLFSQIDISNLTPGVQYFVRVENLSPYPSAESHGYYTLSIQAPQPSPLTVTIDGPTYVSACERGEWNVTTSGGAGNYSYEFYVNSVLISSGSLSSGTSNLYAHYNDNTFTEFLSLEVFINDGSNSTSASKSVNFQGCPSGSRTFLVYPNPASDQLNVEFRDNSNKAVKDAEDFEVQLFDESGQKKTETKLMSNNNKVKVDVKNSKKGVYFLHIFHKGTIIKKQVEIER